MPTLLRLLSLELDNWLSYQKETIDLTKKGFVSLQGSTGAGKSSMFEAVNYLLTGKLTRKPKHLSQLANNQNRAIRGYRIKLVLEFKGEHYSIQEVRDRVNAGFSFGRHEYLENGSKVIHDLRGKSAAETRKNIFRTFQISPNDVATCLWMQGSSRSLVVGTSDTRAKELIRLLDLERYLIALAKATQEKKEVSRKVEKFSQRSQEIKATLKDLPKNIKEEDLEEIKQALARTELRSRAVKKGIRIIEQRIAELRRVEKTRAALQVDLPKSRPGQSQSFYSAKVEKLRLGLGKTRHELRTAQNGLIRANQQDNICPISKEPCEVNVPLRLANKVKQRCSKRIAKIESVESKAKKLISLTELKEQAARKFESFDKLRKQLDLNDAPSLDEIEEEKKKLNKQLAKWEDEQDRLEEVWQALVKKRVEAQNAKKIARIRKKKVRRLKKTTRQLTKAKTTVALIDKATDILKSLQYQRLETNLAYLNKKLQENLQKISSKKLSAELVTTRLDAKQKNLLDYVDILVSTGELQIPLGLCSGGEKIQVEIALTLAIIETAHALTDKTLLSSLWMDEVFGPVSEDVVDNVTKTWRQLVDRLGFETVVVVSHRSLAANIFDEFWAVERTNKGSQLILRA